MFDKAQVYTAEWDGDLDPEAEAGDTFIKVSDAEEVVRAMRDENHSLQTNVARLTILLEQVITTYYNETGKKINLKLRQL